MKHTKQSIISKDGISYLIPFILITFCFALWGFANDITNPMVKAFSKIFRMSATDGALVQVAFYGGYFAMAFPAAIFIRKYSVYSFHGNGRNSYPAIEPCTVFQPDGVTSRNVCSHAVHSSEIASDVYRRPRIA